MRAPLGWDRLMREAPYAKLKGFAGGRLMLRASYAEVERKWNMYTAASLCSPSTAATLCARQPIRQGVAPRQGPNQAHAIAVALHLT